MPTPSSGPISMSDINNNLGRGQNLNAYRGTFYYVGASLGTGNFSNTSISMGDFYNKQATDPASGYVDWVRTAAGNYTWTAPLYRNSVVVEVWGGGGAGGSYIASGRSGDGTSSIFYGPANVVGGGGQGGENARYDTVYSKPTGAGGAGGTASGGNTNITGSSGAGGGSGSTGGAGTSGYGSGGNGYRTPVQKYTTYAGGGGAGGYSRRTYAPGALTTNTTYSVTVGSGGIPDQGGSPYPNAQGGYGGAARVRIQIF